MVLAFHSRLDREEVQEAARLKLVIQNFAGYERVDVQACTEFGIPFCNAASPSGSTVAEMAFDTHFGFETASSCLMWMPCGLGNVSFSKQYVG